MVMKAKKKMTKLIQLFSLQTQTIGFRYGFCTHGGND